MSNTPPEEPSRHAPTWRRYLRFWGVRLDDDVDDELAFHVEMRVRDYVARGMNEPDARAAALGRIGNVPDTRAACLTIGRRRQRRMTRSQTLDAFVQDARYAARTLGRQLGWTAIAVLTLAVGIGTTTAVFGVVNSLILNPLPYRNGDRVVMVWRVDPKSGVMISAGGKMVDVWDKQARSIEGMEPYQIGDMTLTGRGDPTVARVAAVRSGFVRFTGLRTIVGRTFLPEEARPGGPHVVMLGEQLWRSRFGGARDVVGQKLILNDKPYTIVGVAPANLRLPGLMPTDAWLAIGPDTLGYSRQAIARLKPGITVDVATRELEALLAQNRLDDTFLAKAFKVKLTRAGDMVGFRSSLFLLSGAVGLLLLVACANVAHLLLARGATRERELAIRVALGAGRWRLGRQLLTESLLLALFGCAAGLVVGFAAIKALLVLRPPTLTQLALAQLDGRALAVALAVSVLTGIVFGCTAAVHAIRRTTSESLRATSPAGTATKSGHRLRSFLVVTEMALSALLLVGAVLVVRSVVNLQRVDPGFEPHDLYSMAIKLPESRYSANEQRAAFADAVAERARLIPGVSAVIVSQSAPPEVGGYMMAEMHGEGAASGVNPSFTPFTNIPADYFAMLRMPIVAGTTFTAGSAERREIVINEGLAKKLWPGQPAVGHRLRLGTPSKDSDGWNTVVAVVADVTVRGPSNDRDDPILYFPLQRKEWGSEMTLIARVRPGTDPTAVLRPIVVSLDARLVPPAVRSVEAALAETIATQRFTMTLLAVFAGLAVALSAIGLYGVISYVVTQRAREIGIRIALGATPRHVARAVVAPGLVLSSVGLAIGLGAAVWGTKVIQASLYGVTGTDPVSYAAAGALLLGISLLACLVPMRRAMAVDPVIAMRGD